MSQRRVRVILKEIDHDLLAVKTEQRKLNRELERHKSLRRAYLEARELELVATNIDQAAHCDRMANAEEVQIRRLNELLVNFTNLYNRLDIIIKTQKYTSDFDKILSDIERWFEELEHQAPVDDASEDAGGGGGLHGLKRGREIVQRIRRDVKIYRNDQFEESAQAPSDNTPEARYNLEARMVDMALPVIVSQRIDRNDARGGLAQLLNLAGSGGAVPELPAAAPAIEEESGAVRA